ncbi:acid-sensing ion channel 2-like [Mytilus edulis]|uniref:acid-sensing ion channel 2-like n=1 Tax=Mytilus edulis TaxID=6550 RepID=UPI0039EE1FD2
MNYFDINITKKAVRKLSPDFKEFVLSCKYEGELCNESSFMPFFDPYYGQCYRFPRKPLVTKHVGQLFAFQLFLNVNQSDYIPYVADDPGVVLSIHENGYRPYLQSNGFSVSPGFKTDISLFQKRMLRKKEVFGNTDLCDDSGEFTNIQACFELCIEKIIEKNCNCSPTLSDVSLGLWICDDAEELQCMAQAEKSSDNCSCKEPCNEIKYETFRSMTTWPGRSYVGVLDAILKQRGVAYQDLRESLLFVNIYFSSLQEEVTEEELAYTIENFWSDIGGSLGLWVGMSVISLGEVLELGILILRFIKKRSVRLLSTDHKRGEAEDKLNDGLNQIIKGFNGMNEEKQEGRTEFNDGLNKILKSINMLTAEQQKRENDENANYSEISIVENALPKQYNVFPDHVL